MRRIVPVLLSLLLVAGCEGGGAPPADQPLVQLHAGFAPGGIADTIGIDAIERLPLRAAELVAPDGKTTRAESIDVVPSPTFATGQWTAANPWRNALAGDGSVAALTTPQVQAGAALTGREQLLATVSRAEITLPDPVAYRRQWQHYRIRLTFGTPPGEVETREIAAPAPSPGS